MSRSPSRSGNTVVILGAGLAGLSSAYLLSRAGYDVTVIEARDRPGGRIETLSQPFSDHLHAEAGAFFISSLHSLVMHYVRLFDLSLDPILPSEGSLRYFLKGECYDVGINARGIGRHAPDYNPKKKSWPSLALKENEEEDGLFVFLTKYCGIGQLGDPTDPLWPQEAFKKHDMLSFQDYLRQPENNGGASPDSMALIKPWFAPWWDELENISALHLRRDAAIGLSVGVRERAWFTLTDGMNALPQQFANRLKGKIRYNAQVLNVVQDSKSVVVTFLDLKSRSKHEVKASRVVCTIPFPCLRKIEGIEAWSRHKRRAIEELPYARVARVYLQCRDRSVWTTSQWKGALYTDLPIMNVLDSTMNQHGSKRGILHAFISGEEATKLATLPIRKSVAFVEEHLKGIYKNLEIETEHCATKFWHTDEWAQGAYAFYRPGQMFDLLPAVAAAEGRIHFAGDHASSWPGWMQGALESGHRAASEISLAPN